MSLTPYSKVPDFVFYFIIALYSFFNPMLAQYSLLLFLVIIDTVSGIFLARHKKIKFSWIKFSTILDKICGYTLICISGYILDIIFISKVFGEPFMFNIFMMLLALNEFKSLVDNCGIILGIDVWRMVIKSFNKNKNIDEK